MLRFATPVQDLNGEKQGILIFNYRGEYLLNNFLRPDIPIIIATGFSGVLNEEVAEEQGIRAYYNKPVDSYALLNKINNILSSTEKTDVRVPMSTN